MKKAQVIWTTEAIGDLEIIFDFLSINSTVAAQRICENILGRAKQIETFPDSGSLHRSLKNSNKNYRYLVEGNYKIIYSYQVNPEAAYIHAVFDARLDPEKLNV